MSNKIQSWIARASSGRNQRALRGIASMFLNDDLDNTFKGITFGANTTNITMSGAYTTGLLLSGVGTTGIGITGTVAKGVDSTDATLTQSWNNAFFACGSGNGSAGDQHSVTVTDHYIPLQINMASIANPAAAKHFTCAMFRTDVITADQSFTLANPIAVRADIQKDIYGGSGINVDMSVTEDISIGGESLKAGYFAISGDGAITCSGDCNVLEAVYKQTSGGSGIDNVAQFHSNASGCSVADLLHLRNVAGTVTNGLHISGACTTAINVSTVQTDETGLTAAALLQHGSYSTGLAYGTQADFLIMKSMHITGAATGTYIFGDVNRIDTSADSTGYIHVGYNYLSVGHALANGYATRSRLAITDDCELGEQVACLATMEIGAHTLSGAGDLRAGLFELNIAAGAVVATEAHCVEIRPLVAENVAGITSGIRVNINCSSPNYVDFGIDIRSMSSQQTAAMRILATPASDALPVGIHIEGQSSTTSTITHAISLVGTITNALHFNETDGSQAALTMGTYNSGYDQTPIASIKIDMNGTAGYIYVHDTIIGVT